MDDATKANALRRLGRLLEHPEHYDNLNRPFIKTKTGKEVYYEVIDNARFKVFSKTKSTKITVTRSQFVEFLYKIDKE